MSYLFYLKHLGYIWDPLGCLFTILLPISLTVCNCYYKFNIYMLMFVPCCSIYFVSVSDYVANIYTNGIVLLYSSNLNLVLWSFIFLRDVTMLFKPTFLAVQCCIIKNTMTYSLALFMLFSIFHIWMFLCIILSRFLWTKVQDFH